MKTIRTSELPEQLEGFAGGMGFKSIASISASDLGFDNDVTGYISEEVDGKYYAEVLDRDGNGEYAEGHIGELQKWITDKVYEYCQEAETLSEAIEAGLRIKATYVPTGEKVEWLNAEEFGYAPRVLFIDGSERVVERNDLIDFTWHKKKTFYDFCEDDFNWYSMPKEVREILDRYLTEDNTYDIMRTIRAELNSIGYEMDYDLSAEIVSIQKIEPNQ